MSIIVFMITLCFVIALISGIITVFFGGLRPSIKYVLIGFISILFLASNGYQLFAAIDREIFRKSSNGEIRLNLTPMKIPSNAPNTYCTIFKDKNGKSTDIITYQDNQRYCGQFYDLRESTGKLTPYKLTKEGVLYWAGPGKVVMDITSQDPIKRLENSNSQDY